jgi:PIN domain nuclease of toxin-antitoxin system
VKALLDTHTFLWWVDDDRRLSTPARRLITDGSNEVYFSAASAWEITIKAALGRLTMSGDLEEFITEQLTVNQFLPLPIHLHHAFGIYSLPPHHKDPFDRLLVAQALAEELTLVSADPQLAKYRVPIVW